MLHFSELVMNRLNTTESAIFIYLVHSLLPRNLAKCIQNLFISTAAGVVLCGGRKHLSIYHHSANNNFWSFGPLSSFKSF